MQQSSSLMPMSRLFLFGIGVALTLLLMFWGFFGIVMFIGYGAYGFKADIFVVIWGIVFLSCLWGAFGVFRRAFKSPRKGPGKSSGAASELDSAASRPESVEAEKSAGAKMVTTDEKLAALL